MSTTDLHNANLPTDAPVAETALNHNDNTEPSKTTKKSSQLLSPTVKGALIGAVAGHFLPVFNTVTGAIVGGITAKVLNRKHCKQTAFQ
ncbi:MAG: hypothetical protein LKF82_07565 [Acinetobacter populi]|uniref:hypothetical protein n=1 Tax=Acinetobacter populi TaxID=1582270 RepID=UPI0023539C9C|nr:hypothetical protein [Acinetobacter populi]MCH4247682.1 hypothetical protein [Acinetobacter populi]